GKKLGPVPGDPFGALGMVRKERRGELAAEEARKRDQAVAALLERAPRNDRARAVLIRQPGARQQLAKAQVPGARCAQQQPPEGLVALGLVLDPAVGADQRLDPSAARRAVELHHA